MLIVKFCVLFGYISVLSAHLSYYCKICSNHTLCQYKNPGPGAACKSYDRRALLTDQEVQELINKINEIRNHVATGQSKMLPQAANMKKVRWSSELASFAQRWADQCDQTLRPDKEDYCRDLVNAKVGQNIGSVVGPTPGLNVKSFVDMWFMQILDYAGTVTYYNQSRDYSTKYFTQLIWAETEFVGCAKVKFYAYDKKVMIERLVCNFSPSGNIHGKSVYAIGYAATQCANNMEADVQYEGLCKAEDPALFRKLTTQRPPVSSLLKIRNLSNGTVRHELDPIRNNFKQTNLKKKRQKNQKTRHVLLTSYDAFRHTLLRKDNNMKKSLVHTMPRNMNDDGDNFQQQRGHSRLYHGFEEPDRHEQPAIAVYPTANYFQRNNKEDFRRYDYTTAPVYLISSSTDYRKFQQDFECTRRTGRTLSAYCCNNYQCTRGHYYCGLPGQCEKETTAIPTVLDKPCLCSTTCLTTCAITCLPKLPVIDNRNTNCKCNHASAAFVSHNNMPNMLRSGRQRTTEEISSSKEDSEQIGIAKISKTFKVKHEKDTNYRVDEQVEDDIHSKFSLHDSDYLYRPFDSSFIRKRRQLKDEITLKPFWKNNELNYKKIPELKTLKYTTLTNRRNKKTRRNMQTIIRFFTTEPITLRKEDYSNDDSDEQTTEKYLSFDELMYLRKFSDHYMDFSARRKDNDKNKKETKATKATKTTTASKATTTTKKATTTTKKSTTTTKNATKATTASKATTTTKKVTITTTKATKATITTKATTTTTKATTVATMTTSEYTANTPFERQKHCTRKLTCTWTAFTGTAEDGAQLGSIIDFGSRTPPGYVDGCTRTSTCTRDFMDRNKMATASANDGGTRLDSDKGGGGGWGGGVVGGAGGGDENEDEDYCEKRSLKILRRNVAHNIKDATPTTYAFQSYTETQVSGKNSVTESLLKISDCKCDNNISRSKRELKTSHLENSQIMSYADLYYLVLNKIIKTNQARTTKTCPCNFATNNFNFLFIILYLIHVML